MFLSRRDIAVLAAAGFMALGTGVIGGEPAKEKPAKSAVIRDGYETGPPTWQREYTDTTMRLMAHERSDRAARRRAALRAFPVRGGSRQPVLRQPGLAEDSGHGGSGPEPLCPVQPGGCSALRLGRVAGRHRPGHEGPFVRAGARHGIQPARPMGEAGAGRNAAGDRGAGSGTSGLDPAAGAARGGVYRRVVVNLMGGQGRERRLPGRSPGGPRLARDWLAAWAAGRSQTGPELAGPSRAIGEKGWPERDAARTTRRCLRSGSPAASSRSSRVSERYVRWFPTAIDAPGANPLELRRRRVRRPGHRRQARPEGFGPAVERGMLLLPRLSGATEEGGIERVLAAMAAYPLPGSVLLWSIGEHLGSQRESAARDAGGRSRPRGPRGHP